MSFSRVLVEDAPRLKYEPDLSLPNRHWGQRKLLMAEIEFLVKFATSDCKTVVYAGASPGEHVPFLSEMFPKLEFVLYDPRPFGIQSTERISLKQQFFADKDAKEFADRKDVLFLSDIRNLPENFKTTVSQSQIDQNIKKDMKDQMRWHEIVKPVASLLKFRLPWDDEKTEYLDGELFLPVWGPRSTTECRLAVTGMKTKVYDNRKYEEQMAYFNRKTRSTSFDSVSESHILSSWLQKNSTTDKRDVSHLSLDITEMFGKNKHRLVQTRHHTIKRRKT
jgi:cap2 methyltransferase